MKSSSFFQRLFPVFIVTTLVFACSTPPSDVQVIEIDYTQEIVAQIVSMNNCGGLADADQTITRSFSTSFDSNFSASFGIKKIAEGEITAKYGQGQSTSQSIKVTAAPGSNMKFTLEWTEQTWIGRVIADSQSGNYTARLPISVSLVDAQNLLCSDAPTPIHTTGTSESRNWIATFDYSFPSGFWAIGTHQYSFNFSCPNDVTDNNGNVTTSFEVSNSYPTEPKEVYLRWSGVRDSKLPNPGTLIGVNPAQVTIAVITWPNLTEAEAKRVETSCIATISWDGGNAQPLIPQKPYQY